MRSEDEDLRLRSDRLRERSRDLQQRSQRCRSWTQQAARRVEADSVPADDARERERLLRAETDLERAIDACRSALAEVRRELRWPDQGTPRIVH